MAVKNIGNWKQSQILYKSTMRRRRIMRAVGICGKAILLASVAAFIFCVLAF